MTNAADQYFQRYHAGTTEQRRGAIIKLGKSSDARALPLLEQIADSDADAALRDLAVKAIRHIEAQSVPPANRNADPYEPPIALSVQGVASTADVVPAIAPSIMPVAVSEQKRKLARSQLDHALSLQMSGQNDKAQAMLAEAARTDPGLLSDPFAMNLAMSLTGESIDQAVATIRAQSADANTTRSVTAIPIGLAEVIETLLELVVLCIVVTVFVGAFYYGRSRLFSSTLLPLGSRQATEQLALLTEAFNPSNMLPESLKFSLEWILSTLVSILAIYVVGTLTGGSGGFFRFVRWLARAYMGIFAVELAGALLILFSVISFTQNPASQQTALTLASVGLFLMGITLLLGFVVVAWTVGRAHEFGFWRGLRAISLGGLVVRIGLFLISMLTAFSTR